MAMENSNAYTFSLGTSSRHGEMFQLGLDCKTSHQLRITLCCGGQIPNPNIPQQKSCKVRLQRPWLPCPVASSVTIHLASALLEVQEASPGVQLRWTQNLLVEVVAMQRRLNAARLATTFWGWDGDFDGKSWHVSDVMDHYFLETTLNYLSFLD